MATRLGMAASTRSSSMETPFTYLSIDTTMDHLMDDPMDDLMEDPMEGIECLIANESNRQTSPPSSDSDDLELLWSSDSSQTTGVSSTNGPAKGGSPELPIDLTEDSQSEKSEDFEDSAIGALVEQLNIDEPARSTELDTDHAIISRRSLHPVPDAHTLGESLAFDDSSVLLGISVEFTDGTYMFVEQVMDYAGQPFVHGRHMVQTNTLVEPKGIPKVDGELIWEAHVTTPIPVDRIRELREVEFTNRRPLRWLPHTSLICRLKYTLTELPDRIMQSTQSIREGHKDLAVEWLTCEEVDSASGFGRTSQELREAWRGTGRTIPFGSMELPAVPAFDLDLEDSDPPFVDLDEDRNRTYTFGDAYCGAGGASCGAKKARLALTWAVDKDKHAVLTYGTNFPESLVEHAEFDMFMTNTAEDLRVDVCHTSPPCQPFSPAHTIPNQVRDEINSSCIFTSHDLIMKVRPRILTMEETFGLPGRHEDTFYRIIMDFIEVGYSVRWGILDCIDYGVPQIRRRLIIIAAGPGEQLPKMPSPTHGGPGTCLLPVATIHSAISDIPLDATDHDVETLEERGRLAFRSPYDPHQPARTLTCSGGQANYHPSGTRGLTIREAACLQTFPMNFQFCGLSRRKQVGNAVPVRFAHAIFREVVRSLRQTDEKELSQGRITVQNELIQLD